MAWSEEKIQKVWEKGKTVTGYDPDKWRKDHRDAWINRNSHGNRESAYGWEVSHIKPKSGGGSDSLSNLRPLQWENNAASEDQETVTCVVTSKDNKNVRAQ